MTSLGLFQSSALAMDGQSQALELIGTNIANVSTPAYKRTDVYFATVLGNSIAGSAVDEDLGHLSLQDDLGGVVTTGRSTTALNGAIQTTGNELDVALAGAGFFVLSKDVDGGELVYGRDGHFSIGVAGTDTAVGADGGAIVVDQGYLVDDNGYFLQGWAPNADGTFPTEGETTAMRVDSYAYGTVGIPTTTGGLDVNLPAGADTGTVHTSVLNVFDSDAEARSLTASFTKSATTNTWTFDLQAGDGDTVTLTPAEDLNLATAAGAETVFSLATNTVAVRLSDGSAGTGFFTQIDDGDVITVSGTGGNDGVYEVASVSGDGSTLTLSATTPLAADETNAAVTTFSGTELLGETLVFDSLGQLTTSPTYAVTVDHADGATSSFTLDVSALTQVADSYTLRDFSQDGHEAGELESVAFDDDGFVVGNFDNGTTVRLYRLAVADFINPGGLIAETGNVYSVGEESGDAALGAVGTNGIGDLVVGGRELSNVDLADEFTRMIATQRAYSTATTAFRTVDEMLQTAGNMKR